MIHAALAAMIYIYIYSHDLCVWRYASQVIHINILIYIYTHIHMHIYMLLHSLHACIHTFHLIDCVALAQEIVRSRCIGIVV